MYPARSLATNEGEQYSFCTVQLRRKEERSLFPSSSFDGEREGGRGRERCVEKVRSLQYECVFTILLSRSHRYDCIPLTVQYWACCLFIRYLAPPLSSMTNRFFFCKSYLFTITLFKHIALFSESWGRPFFKVCTVLYNSGLLYFYCTVVGPSGPEDRSAVAVT